MAEHTEEKMMEILSLLDVLKGRFQNAQFDLSEPFHKDGTWILNVWHDGYALAIQWNKEQSFGISSEDNSVYGEGAHVTVSSLIDAIGVTVELLSSKSKTEPIRFDKLSELRRLKGVTQSEMSRRIGKGQSYISKLEKKSNPTLREFGELIAALGGRPLIGAQFNDDFVVFDHLTSTGDSV